MAVRRSIHRISRPGELAALRSPVRQRLIGAMEGLGPCTVSELAERLSLEPAALYYHVRQLEAAGLVRRRGTRPTRTRAGVLYELVSPLIRTDPDNRSKPFVRGLARLYETMLRMTARRVATALEWPGTHRGGSRRNFRARIYDVRLTRAGVRRVNRLLDEVEACLRDDELQAGDRGYAVTLVMTPLEEGN